MGTSTKKFNPAPFVTLFITCACLLPVNGCTRYARTVKICSTSRPRPFAVVQE